MSGFDTGFGCHVVFAISQKAGGIIVAHQKGVAAGTLATLITLTSLIHPFGPGGYTGSERVVQQYQERLFAADPQLKEQTAQAEAAFENIKALQQHRLSDKTLRRVLKICLECEKLAPRDLKLKNKRGLLAHIQQSYFLALVSDLGLEQAIEQYLKE